MNRPSIDTDTDTDIGTVGPSSTAGTSPTAGRGEQSHDVAAEFPDRLNAADRRLLRTLGLGGSERDRYYQVAAVEAIVSGLDGGGRGQIRCACGTGKTRIAIRAAQRMCAPGSVVAVVVPSVWLVNQTQRAWRACGVDHVALAVCHDATVAADPGHYGLTVPVTTSSRQLADWLAADHPPAALRVVVGTHRSAMVIGDALRATDTRAELLIIDEAHRTAGRAGKRSALVHQNHRLPARRRLYATATPKLLDRAAAPPGSETSRAYSMDDIEVFGPVLYTYPFTRGIADGYLDDYRIAVIGVTEKHARALLAELPPSTTLPDAPIDLRTAMMQTVVAKAAAEFGLRRVLVFTHRVRDAMSFAATLPDTVARMPPADAPAGELTATYVHGEMPSSERLRRLALLEEPPSGGWTVLSNVACLSEGVDVPAVDAVAFTHPKESVAEIVQAIGRAVRPNPEGSGVATVIVPILLPEDPDILADGEFDPDTIDAAGYRLLWQVVRALREHDDAFGGIIDNARVHHHRGPRRPGEAALPALSVHTPPEFDAAALLHRLTVRVVSTARSRWWNGLDALRAVHAELGHTDLAPGTIVDEIDLWRWAQRTRLEHNRRQLPADRIEALQALGFDLAVDAAGWAAGLRAAAEFRRRHGHLEAPADLTVDGVEVRSWLDTQRDLGAEGALDSRRRARLDLLGMRWSGRPRTDSEFLDAAAAYHQRHGDLCIRPDPATDDGHLGRWLMIQRLARRRGRLDTRIEARLAELGIDWDWTALTAPR